METTKVLVDAYANQTFLPPVIAVVLAVLCVAILAAKRRYVIVPILISQSFLSGAFRVVVGGLDFKILRIIIVVCLTRIILRAEYKSFRRTAMDLLVMAYCALRAVFYTLQSPSMGSAIYAVSEMFDVLGAFFLVRMIIRDLGDIQVAVRTFVVVSMILLPLFFFEQLRGFNFFSVFGGVNPISIFREGRFRAQGAYPHPILAGAYWAAIFPLLLGFRKKGTPWTTIAIFCGLGIIYCSASSTPIMSVALALAAFLFFYQRSWLNDLLLAAGVAIVGLMAFWKHPIWYLFAKIDVTGGSTGYFRYLLIDRFVANWKQWILFGVRSTAGWGEGLMLASVGLADVTNQFVLEGVRGGGISLLLFIAIVLVSFKYVGRMVLKAEDSGDKLKFWCIGVSLLAHLANFLGVSYFDQTVFSWWFALAIISGLYQHYCMAPGGNGLAEAGLLRQDSAGKGLIQG